MTDAHLPDRPCLQPWPLPVDEDDPVGVHDPPWDLWNVEGLPRPTRLALGVAAIVGTLVGEAVLAVARRVARLLR